MNHEQALILVLSILCVVQAVAIAILCQRNRQLYKANAGLFRAARMYSDDAYQWEVYSHSWRLACHQLDQEVVRLRQMAGDPDSEWWKTGGKPPWEENGDE